MKVSLHTASDGQFLSFAQEHPPFKTFWLKIHPGLTVEEMSVRLNDVSRQMMGFAPPGEKAPVLTLVPNSPVSGDPSGSS